MNCFTAFKFVLDLALLHICYTMRQLLFGQQISCQTRFSAACGSIATDVFSQGNVK